MNDNEIIVIKTKELRQIIREEVKAANGQNEPDFKSDRLTRIAAEKLAGVSSPTFLKMIKAGIFPEHGIGRKKFFLQSEVIAGLKKEANKPQLQLNK